MTLAAALLLVSASAFGQSAGEKTGINSTLGISPSTADFVKEAAMSDMTEIAASKIGQERGNAEEKAFAGQMITDHTKTSGELKQLVSSGDVKAEIPAALDSSSQSKVDKLKNAKPDDFSSDFDSMQVSAGLSVRALHQGRRRSEAEGLGGQDLAAPAAPSRNGAEPGQEEIARLPPATSLVSIRIPERRDTCRPRAAIGGAPCRP
jgi:putative membrane protein